MAPNLARQAIIARRVDGCRNNGDNGYPRLEIDDFCQDEAMLNLYLLAMEALQLNHNFRDPWSWFMIQGIHGAPWVDWDGVGRTALYAVIKKRHWLIRDKRIPGAVPTEGVETAGYCNHNSVLFPSWHRAYGAMIEQAIQAVMVEVADQFPKTTAPNDLGARSRSAALRFRQPYWDPFRARSGEAYNNTLQSGLSLIFAVKKVRVTRPSMVVDTINNPIYSYEYPTTATFQSTLTPPLNPPLGPRGDWAGHDISLERTSRRPPASQPSISDNVAVQRELEGMSGRNLAGATVPLWHALMEKAYHTLMLDEPGMVKTKPGAYHRFSTTQWQIAQKAAGGTPAPIPRLRLVSDALSLESWHNNIHTIIGGDGTMSFPRTAGFDPIFIFHHANVDRHYALWQAKWPDLWWGVNDIASTDDGYTFKANTFERPDTPLFPFRKPKEKRKDKIDEFWTTDNIRNHAVFGYQYDPIPTKMARDKRITEANRVINSEMSWFTAMPSAIMGPVVNPVPNMEQLSVFVQNPPLLDEMTTVTSLWTSRASATTPAPTPAPPAGPGPGPGPAPPFGPTPFRLVGPSTPAIPLHQRTVQSTATSQKAQKTLPAEDRDDETEPAPASPSQGHTTLPDSDFTYIFPPGTMTKDARVPIWFFNFRCLRHALHTSFTVFVFLGNFPADSTEWHSCENLAMPLAQFVTHNPDAFENGDSDDEEGEEVDSTEDGHRPRYWKLKQERERGINAHCGNCAQQERDGVFMADAAPLTLHLIRHLRNGAIVPDPEDIREGELPGVALQDLSEEQVVPFLQRNLHWRILRADGAEIDRGSISQFKAFVTRRFVTLPKKLEDAPKYETAEVFWDVTDHRPGGLEDGALP